MNKWIGMGRLTKDPELRYATNTNNTAVCRYTLAVDRRFKKQGEENTDYIPCVALGKTGEFIGKYFTKGSKIAVVGAIQTRTWDDQEGKRHYVTEVLVDEAYSTEGKRQDNNQQEEQQGFYPLEDDSDDTLPFK
jgi:single-strand DNA-binding protein